MVNYGNYTLVDLTVVPTFFLLNQTGHEVNQNEGIMSLSQLSDFLNIETILVEKRR
jgi:hypothetical protein